jgi:hypothetical protein
VNCQARRIDCWVDFGVFSRPYQDVHEPEPSFILPYFECVLPPYHEGDHAWSTELVDPDGVAIT